MNRFAIALATLLSFAGPLVPAIASAQDDAAIQMARERFQEGVKFYDAKQYDKARAAFLQAYALKRHPAVLLNLAQSELRSSREADAAKHFAQYLRENKEASAMERQEAEKGLSTAKASVGEIAVNVSTEGADVYVDGNLEGRSPLPGPVYLKPGSHNVEARKDGKSAPSAVTAIAGQTGSVELNLGAGSAAGPLPVAPVGGGEPPGGTAAPPTGEGPASGAGSGSGPGPGPGVGPDKGGDKPSFLGWAKDNKVAWIGGGITVLGLAGGVGFALASKQSYDDAESIRQQIIQKGNQTGVSGPCGPPPKAVPGVVNFADACQRYDSRVSDGDSQKTLATVSFVVAGVAAAGTVIYYFIDTGSNKATIGGKAARSRSAKKDRGIRASVVPFVGPSERGLGVIGQF
ncbi:MAG: PEGA domain-containing protein [Polyangiaceae bacterium]